MQTENMKLLGLQTGKYLELGKDFYYGGDSVYLIERLEGCLKSHNKWLVSLIDTALRYEHKSNQRNISYDLAQKVVDNHAKTENKVVKSQSESGLIYKSESPLELKEICEKVGAVAYGGRYVLFLDPAMGSAYNIKNKYRGEEFIDYKCKNGDFSSGYNIYNNDIITFLGNIFEEYSKQLRNEENKFEELMEKLK